MCSTARARTGTRVDRSAPLARKLPLSLHPQRISESLTWESLLPSDPGDRRPPANARASRRLLQWSFATSSYAETAGGWAFSDERDARILQQFFDVFGIVERAGMRTDPFALWQAMSHEFRDDVLRILKRTGRLRPLSH